MSVLRGLLVLVGALALGWADAASGRELAVFHVNGWHIQAFSSERTGKFSDCVAIREYGTSVLGFDLTDGARWFMAFKNTSVKVRKGQKLEISFVVDKGMVYRTTGEVGPKGLVHLPLLGDARLLDAFRQGEMLRIAFKEVTISYKLEGMAPMMKALQECPQRFAKVADTVPAPVSTPASASASKPQMEASVERPAAKPEKGAGKERVYTGSGFFVSRDGAVLTNAHVVEGCAEATITGFGKAAIIAANKKDDLALLKLTTAAKTEGVRFRKTGAQLGEAIYVLGFPLAGQLDNGLNFTSGVISSLAGPGNDPRAIQFSAPAQPGNSGGPVTDGSGLVVGVTQSKLNEVAAIKSGGAFPQNVNFGIKSPLATSFLRANGIEPQEVDSGKPIPSVAIAKEAASYTVQVMCRPK